MLRLRLLLQLRLRLWLRPPLAITLECILRKAEGSSCSLRVNLACSWSNFACVFVLNFVCLFGDVCSDRLFNVCGGQ
jgi:hypothetical protein